MAGSWLRRTTRFFFFSALCLTGLSVTCCAAPPSTRVWVTDVKEALPLPEPRLLRIARAVHEALDKQRIPSDFLAEFGADAAPRAVFISVAGPWWAEAEQRNIEARKGKRGSRQPPSAPHPPARVFYGGGAGLPAAMHEALEAALEHRRGLQSMTGVKVDIVQYVAPSGPVLVRSARVTYPGFAGLAFSPRTGIAFLPEQMLGLAFLDPAGRIRIHRVEEILAAEGRWKTLGIWNALASFTMPQPAWRFECSSASADAHGAEVLFRGHRLLQKTDRQHLFSCARRTAQRLADACTPAGRFVIDIPGWAETFDDLRPLHASVQGVRLFYRMANALKRGPAADPDAAAKFANKARRLLDHVQRRFRPVPGVAGASALVEIETFRLDTNAEFALALCEALRWKKEESVEAQLLRAGRFLLSQIQPDGTLLMGRSARAGSLSNGAAGPHAAGLTALALVRCYESIAVRAFYAGAAAAGNALLRDFFEKKPMDQLPPDDAAGIALNDLFTFSRDRRCVEQAERLALALAADQNTGPDLLDMIGSFQRDPTCSGAARRVRAMLAAGSLLHDRGKTEAAQRVFSAVRLGLLYILTCRLETPCLLYIDHAERYPGLFREDLSAFQCTFEGQVLAAMTLLDAVDILRDLDADEFQLLKQDAERLEKAHRRIEEFPRILGVVAEQPEARRPRPGKTPVIHAVPKSEH